MLEEPLIRLGPIECDKVLSHLHSLEEKKALGKSLRRYNLLRYITEAEIEGRGHTVKAYSIGIDVIGRGSDFDPSIDSIVRVEISRLRDALALHYAKDPVSVYEVRIKIPKGTLRPVFNFSDTTVDRSSEDENRHSTNITRINLDEYNESRQRLRNKLIKTLKLHKVMLAFLVSLLVCAILLVSNAKPRNLDRPVVEITGDLPNTQMTEIKRLLLQYRNVISVDDSYSDIPMLNPDYQFAATRGEADKFSLELTHIDSGEVLRSSNFDFSSLDFTRIRESNSPLINWIARAFQLNGIVEKDFTKRGDFGDAFACRVLMEAYFRGQSDRSHLDARLCSEELIEEGINYSSLYNNLAILYREEFSDKRNPLPGNPLHRAINSSRRAIEIDPYNAYAHHTMMTILFMIGNHSDAIESGQTAIELAPYDGLILGAFGFWLNTAGEYQKALDLLDRAKDLNPDLARWRDHGVFLANVAIGDLERAAEASLVLNGTNNPLHLADLAIGFWLLGRVDESCSVFTDLAAQEKDFVDMYERRRYQADLTEKLIDLLVNVSNQACLSSPF
ncbi:tetratricopeptide repeat protein [uncultured Ruegeria sp.]|uniref:tetratricopeptide repeat protein n=1 Tax=uncultured Ruegeria sp. TaxID=259304 RepID=UPI00260626D4|nr:tetratricopeptide repeat protein [uncultured Ruegeria sp.]